MFVKSLQLMSFTFVLMAIQNLNPPIAKGSPTICDACQTGYTACRKYCEAKSTTCIGPCLRGYYHCILLEGCTSSSEPN
ncbi:MAG: hypothetical protein ACD_16C00078G0003 [uncultured bacterium]|nr:MAG: hypothetical protein ACD_16C00078G0003 [uncultured bacterium]